MEYKFKYRRIGSWLWTTKKVVGHGVENNRVILYSKNLSIHEIPEFDKLEIKLGQDWKLSVKEAMEKETGNTVEVKLNG